MKINLSDYTPDEHRRALARIIDDIDAQDAAHIAREQARRAAESAAPLEIRAMGNDKRFNWMGGEIAPRVVLAVASLVFIVFLILSAGCNTIEGIGRDIRGAYDGMNHSFDSNGARVPSGR